MTYAGYQRPKNYIGKKGFRGCAVVSPNRPRRCSVFDTHRISVMGSDKLGGRSCCDSKRACITCGLKKSFVDHGNPAYLFLGEAQGRIGSDRLKRECMCMCGVGADERRRK